MQIKRKKERQHACNVLYKVSPLFINYYCFLILRAVLCGLGKGFCPVPVSIGHVAMRTRVQDWTRVRILTGPVITDHWT